MISCNQYFRIFYLVFAYGCTLYIPTVIGTTTCSTENHAHNSFTLKCGPQITKHIKISSNTTVNIAALNNTHNELEAFDILIKHVTEILKEQSVADGRNATILLKKCSKNTKNIILGDIHGTSNSVKVNLQSMKQDGLVQIQKETEQQFDVTITDATTNLIFLGDIGDRGPDSIGTWKLLLTLKAKYPNQVFLLRGNHETINIATQYGLLSEWLKKFPLHLYPKAYDTLKALLSLFNYLPQALFLSTQVGAIHHIVQCCHGGIGLNCTANPLTYTMLPLDFLTHAHVSDELAQQNFISFSVPYGQNNCEQNENILRGFLWGDFGQDDRHNGKSIEHARVEPSMIRFVTHNYDYWATYAHKVGWEKPHENILLEAMIRGHEHHTLGVTCNGIPIKNNEPMNINAAIAPVFTVMSSSLPAYSNAYIELCTTSTGWAVVPHIIPIP